MIPLADRAVRAATAVARAHGLAVTAAVPLRESSNVLLHLRPFPVVARVMTATVALHDAPRAWLTREIAVGVHLRRCGAPATAPTTLLPPGPHLKDGLGITFWELVAESPWDGPPDPSELGASLRGLHDALATYDGPPLRDVASIGDEIDGLLRGLRPGPWFDAQRIATAERDLERLAPVLGGGSGSLRATDSRGGADRRPIHGDASISNVLNTPVGPVWNDFEDACAGPVEWDLAGLVLDLRDRGADAAASAEALVAGYGAHREDLMAPLTALHRLYGIAWHASRAELHARSRERLARHLAAAEREVGGPTRVLPEARAQRHGRLRSAGVRDVVGTRARTTSRTSRVPGRL